MATTNKQGFKTTKLERVRTMTKKGDFMNVKISELDQQIYWE